MEFEWDDGKNTINITKHNLSFFEAQEAFFDKTSRGHIATVRFTIRSSRIRIIGAGYWREGRKLYDQ